MRPVSKFPSHRLPGIWKMPYICKLHWLFSRLHFSCWVIWFSTVCSTVSGFCAIV